MGTIATELRLCVLTSFDHCFGLFLSSFFSFLVWLLLFILKLLFRQNDHEECCCCCWSHFASHHFRGSYRDVQNTFVETLSQFSVYLTNRQVVDCVCVAFFFFWNFEPIFRWVTLSLDQEYHVQMVPCQRCYGNRNMKKSKGLCFLQSVTFIWTYSGKVGFQHAVEFHKYFCCQTLFFKFRKRDTLQQSKRSLRRQSTGSMNFASIGKIWNFASKNFQLNQGNKTRQHSPMLRTWICAFLPFGFLNFALPNIS